MSSNVEVPTLGESVTEAVLVQWLKNEGDQVAVDEPICELESDKATVDLPAPTSGILHPKKKAGESAHVGEVIAEIEEAAKPAAADEPSNKDVATGDEKQTVREADRQPQRPPAHREITAKEKWKVAAPEPITLPPPPTDKTPSARENKVRHQEPQERPSEKEQLAPPHEPPVKRSVETEPKQRAAAAIRPTAQPPESVEGVRRQPMSKIRRSIAERLVRATQTTAMLTTFNEIDMTSIQELRDRHQDRFREIHGVGLGLMPFFARSAVLALARFPELNARIENDDIIYYEYVHLGVAVSTERGLVVPVLHNVETMSLAQIEKELKRVASAAKEGKLSLADLSGGTFTITNGGVFGSLLSTLILNLPRPGILGMHAIQVRPVAIRCSVEVRPLMYVALTYEHWLVDGQQAVSFLVRVKQVLEDPMQMMLEI